MGATQPGFHERVACMPRGSMPRGRRAGGGVLGSQKGCAVQAVCPGNEGRLGSLDGRSGADSRGSVPQITSHGSHPGLCIIGMAMGKLRPWLALSSWLIKSLVQIVGLIETAV